MTLYDVILNNIFIISECAQNSLMNSGWTRDILFIVSTNISWCVFYVIMLAVDSGAKRAAVGKGLFDDDDDDLFSTASKTTKQPATKTPAVAKTGRASVCWERCNCLLTRSVTGILQRVLLPAGGVFRNTINYNRGLSHFAITVCIHLMSLIELNWGRWLWCTNAYTI